MAYLPDAVRPPDGPVLALAARLPLVLRWGSPRHPGRVPGRRPACPTGLVGAGAYDADFRRRLLAVPRALTCCLLPAVALAGCTARHGQAVGSPAPNGPVAAAPQQPSDGGSQEVSKAVLITYYGHACFTVAAGGKTVAIDPFDASVGYQVPDLEADVCLTTHGHGDHSNTKAVSGGQATLIAQPGVQQAAGLTFTGVAAPHWSAPADKRRGDVVMFRWEMAGVALAHLGDLGRQLTDEQVEQLGHVDVLMVPVGGYFTIGPEDAVAVIRQLQPRVVIPMHYQTAATSDRLPIAPVSEFLKVVPPDWLKAEQQTTTLELTAENVAPEGPLRVIVLQYE